MAVLISQTRGDSITVDIERTPIEDPASLPSTPIEDGLPANRTRYVEPSTVQITIVLARIPGVGDDPRQVLRWIDRVSSRAELVTYVVGDDVRRDLRIGTRTTERDPTTTTIRVSLLLQQVSVIARGTSTAPFPEAAQDARSGTEGTEDGGQQSGEDGPAPGFVRGLF